MINHNDIHVGDNVYVVGDIRFDPSFPNRVIKETGHFLRAEASVTMAYWVKRSQCFKALSESVLKDGYQETYANNVEKNIAQALKVINQIGYRADRIWNGAADTFEDVVLVQPIAWNDVESVSVDVVSEALEALELTCGWSTEPRVLASGAYGLNVKFFDKDESYPITENWHRAVERWIIQYAEVANDSGFNYNDDHFQNWEVEMGDIAGAAETQEAVWMAEGFMSVGDSNNRLLYTNDSLWWRERMIQRLDELGYTTFPSEHETGLMVWDSKDVYLTFDQLLAVLESLGFGDVIRGVGKTQSIGILEVTLR